MSDLEARILILKLSFDSFPKVFEQPHLMASQKLYKYIAGRVKNILTKYHKMHEDLQFELREDVQNILDFCHEKPIDSHLKALRQNEEV